MKDESDSSQIFRFFLCLSGAAFWVAGRVHINVTPLSLLVKSMPANKNALIRYNTIDKCLRNRYRKWTIDDLVDACSDALYEMEGIAKGVSIRTVQGDIQLMRSDKLGYNAPIEVYDNKYYRYADPDYSIRENRLSEDDYELVEKAVTLIGRVEKNTDVAELGKVLLQLKTKLMFLL